MIYIVIPILAVIVFIYLSWQHVSVECHTDLNSTSDLVLSNLERCIDNCWKKHDFGSDREVEDCYTINLFIQDKRIAGNDFSNRNYVKVYFDSLEPKIYHTIKIRYNPVGKEISLVKVE
jgi:hypothetical protein